MAAGSDGSDTGEPVAVQQRHRWWRRWLLRPTMWLLTVLVVLVAISPLLLQLDPVREAARVRIEAELSRLLQRRVDIGSVRLSVLPMSVDLGDVEIAGPPGGEPTLTLQRARVEIDPLALLRREVRLELVELDAPRVVMVFTEDGDSLPRPLPGAGGESKWSVEADRLLVRDGQVLIHETTLPLDLEARDVRVEATGTGGLTLLGEVEIGAIDLELAGLEPIPVALTAEFALGETGLRLREIDATGPGLVVSAHGAVGWSNPSRVALEVEATVSDSFARALGVVEDEVEGQVELEGTFEWGGGSRGGPAGGASSWGARALVRSERLLLAGVEMSNLEGRLAADRHRIVLDLDSSRVLDGGFDGRLVLDPQAGTKGTLEVEGALERVSLARLLGRVGLELEGLDGLLSGPLQLALGLDDWTQLAGRARLEAAAGVASVGVLQGRVDADAAGGKLDLAWTLESPRHQLVGGGRLDLPTFRGRLHNSATTDDLGALLAALPWQVEASWWPSAGRGRVDAAVELGAEVAVHLVVDLFEARATGWRADRLAGVVDISERGAERIRLEAQLGDAALLVTGTAPFDDRPLALAFEAAQWPAEDLRVWLPGSPPVGGDVTGSFELRGSAEALGGSFSARLERASFAEQALGGAVVVTGSFDPDQLVIDHAELLAPAGCVVVHGRLGLRDSALDFSVSVVDLDLSAAPFPELLGRSLPVLGTISGHVAGTLEDPFVEAELHTFSELGAGRFDVSYAGGQVALAGTLPAGLSISGGGAVSAQTSRLTLDVAASDLDRLAQLLGLGAGTVGGRAAGRVELDLTPGDVGAELNLTELEIRRGETTLVALEPVELVLEGDRLRVQSVYLGTQDGASEIFVGGSVYLGERRLDLVVQAGLSLAQLESFAGLELAATGRAEVLSTVKGPLDDPVLRGQAAIRSARLHPAASPYPVEEIEAQVLLDPGAVVLDSATAQFAGGSLRLQGRLDFDGEVPTFRVQAQAREVSMRVQRGLTVAGGAELVWSGTTTTSAITGRVDIDRASYAQSIETDPLRLVRAALQHQRLQVASADEALGAIQLSVAVVAPGTIRIRNNLARLDASADLVVRGTLARPLVFGRAQSLPGGTFEYSGNTYEIERGVISFIDPLRIDPNLDVVAVTRVGAYAVSLAVGGTLEQLELSFASDPPLADLEVLALVAGGEGAADKIAAGSTGVQTSLRTEAESLLLGQAAALIEKRVGTLFGLDSVQIEPLAAGGETLSSARVTVGRQISSGLRATYSWDPSSTEQQRLRVEWLAGDGWTLVMTQNGDGSYSIDSRWERRF